MPAPRQPKRARTLEMQVGGHEGVKQSGEGDLIMKPCLPAERDFYQAIAADNRLAKLRGLVPQFYGTLRLEGEVDEGGDVGADQLREVLAKNSGKDQGKDKLFLATLVDEADSIVLENLSYRFRKPNILDIKLGTVLYDDTASEEKKARMIKTAKETTSLDTGVRLTGFSVFDPASQAYTITPKEYGKSIKAEQLPEGIARFFPETVPRESLLKVLSAVHSKVLEIQQALAETEIRMVGGSVLIVWEGDPTALARAIETADSGRDVMEESDDEDEELEESARKPGPVCIVKLIDFAHTRLVPGEGPDGGVMMGLGVTIKLLEGRIQELRRG
ncbi:hypothetical protein FRC10_008277 [Ceratobasidium sp. 414]|nr:hypothetical protein FRC10_008277 [Ceratobasidium sp. 414]